jgi:pimeloyl-ACP methyl ester carboxylesterase
VVGQSRGGTFARVLAVRRPDLVRGIVTLGSPHVDPLAVHPAVWVPAAAIAALGSIGVPGIASHTCVLGSCCEQFVGDLRAEFPTKVRFVAVYSRSDGIVDWRACLDPAAEQIEVDASHCGMAVSAPVYRELAFALGAFAAPESPSWAQAA